MRRQIKTGDLQESDISWAVTKSTIKLIGIVCLTAVGLSLLAFCSNRDASSVKVGDRGSNDRRPDVGAGNVDQNRTCRAIYYDKPPKTGSTAMQRILEGVAKINNIALNEAYCGNGCQGYDPSSVGDLIHKISAGHKRWRRGSLTGYKKGQGGTCLFTSIRPPRDLLVSEARHIATRIKGRNATAKDVASAFRELASRRSYPLMARWYGLDQGAGAAEMIDTLKKFDCIVDTSQPDWQVRLIRSFERAGMRTPGAPGRINVQGNQEGIPLSADDVTAWHMTQEEETYEKAKKLAGEGANCEFTWH